MSIPTTLIYPIDAVRSGGTAATFGNKLGPFLYQGSLYCCAFDFSVLNSAGVLNVYRSTDGGVTWIAQDPAFPSPYHAEVDTFWDGVSENFYFCVTTGTIDGAESAHAGSFNMATNLYGTAPPPITISDPFNETTPPRVSKTSSGISLLYIDADGNMAFSLNSGGTWGTPVVLDPSSNSPRRPAANVVDAHGNVHVLWEAGIAGAYKVKHAVLSASGVLLGSLDIAASAGVDELLLSFTGIKVIDHTVAHGNSIVFLMTAQFQEGIDMLRSDGLSTSPTWTTTRVMTSLVRPFGPSIFLPTSTGARIFWQDSDGFTDTIWFVDTVDGTTFTTPAVYWQQPSFSSSYFKYSLSGISFSDTEYGLIATITGDDNILRYVPSGFPAPVSSGPKHYAY